MPRIEIVYSDRLKSYIDNSVFKASITYAFEMAFSRIGNNQIYPAKRQIKLNGGDAVLVVWEYENQLMVNSFFLEELKEAGFYDQIKKINDVWSL